MTMATKLLGRLRSEASGVINYHSLELESDITSDEIFVGVEKTSSSPSKIKAAISESYQNVKNSAITHFTIAMVSVNLICLISSEGNRINLN